MLSTHFASRLGLALLLWCGLSQAMASSVHPNEGKYIVEVLVFTQTPAPVATEEPGPAVALQAPESQAYIPGPSPWWQALSTQRLKRYAPRRLQLHREARALERSDEHRLLFHRAWRMSVRGQERSLPILIEGGDSYAEQPELVGQLHLSVARYLHLETDLYRNFFVPVASDQGTGELPTGDLQTDDLQTKNRPLLVQKSAAMQQRRRMRSSELHFIDSPYLGLLIRIEPAD